MRRIMICLAAAVAAVAFTGCKLDDGDSRDMDRPARNIWYKLSARLYELESLAQHLTALDAMLTPQWDDIADKLEVRYFDNANITVDEDGDYDIVVFTSSGREIERYHITASGRAVADDNPWTVIYDNGRMEADMTLRRDDDGLHLLLDAAQVDDVYYMYHHTADVLVSYTVDAIRTRIDTRLAGGGGVVSDEADNPRYTISYDITSPMRFDATGSLVEGRVNAVYDDLVTPLSYRVGVVIDRSYVTYEYM